MNETLSANPASKRRGQITLEDVKKMSDEELEIAVAKASGLQNVRAVVVKNVTFQGDDRHCGITSDSGWIPKYCSDLNAMHSVCTGGIDEPWKFRFDAFLRETADRLGVFVFELSARNWCEGLLLTSERGKQKLNA